MKTSKMKRFRFSAGWLIPAAFAGSLLILASACGGSPPAAPYSQPAPAATAQQPVSTPPAAAPAAPSETTGAGEITVTLEDNTFPEEIRVKAGTKVTFVVSNRGSVEHTFEIPDFGVKDGIKSNSTARIAWTVPDKKGAWDAGCYLTDDESHDGMEGTLIIE